MHTPSLVLGGLLLISSAGPGDAQSVPPDAKVSGGMLTDAKGMTLYTFDKDAMGKSNCDGQCLVNWPALVAGASATPTGDWAVITRDDGSKQWSLKGKPLYTFIQDKKPGDITGDGKGGIWHLAMP